MLDWNGGRNAVRLPTAEGAPAGDREGAGGRTLAFSPGSRLAPHPRLMIAMRRGVREYAERAEEHVEQRDEGRQQARRSVVGGSEDLHGRVGPSASDGRRRFKRVAPSLIRNPPPL